MAIIHASLHRPVLFAGVEPAVAITEGAATLGLVIIIGVHVITLVLATLYLGALHVLVARATASDPAITAVYVRSLRFRDYYPPHAYAG